MSEYYYAKRTKNLYIPGSRDPFKLSRSKIDLFLKCQRCFYLDRRLGVSQPPGFPFNLNSAVDHLLKKEFDAHRVRGDAHPLMTKYGIDAVPYQHGELNRWRENFVGVQFSHTPSNFLVFGAIDDVWVSPKDELHVVDYKSTSKEGQVNLDAEWQDGYKRQMEIYQWLFRKNGFKVSSTGYFVYANASRDREAFDARLEFEVMVIPYTGKTDWVDETLMEAKKCLGQEQAPDPSPDCDYCAYRTAAGRAFLAIKPKKEIKISFSKPTKKKTKDAGGEEQASLF